MKGWNDLIANWGQKTISYHILKQTHFLGILEELFLRTLDCYAKYFFCLQVCIYTIFCKFFLRGLVKHIENEIRSARSNFMAFKNRIMLNVSQTKTEENTSITCSSKLWHNEQNKWRSKLLFSLRLMLDPPS